MIRISPWRLRLLRIIRSNWPKCEYKLRPMAAGKCRKPVLIHAWAWPRALWVCCDCPRKSA